MSTITSNLARRIPLSTSKVTEQGASDRPLMESLEPRLLLSGDGIDIEKFVYVEPAPIAGEIMCNDYAYGKPVELTMKYTGGGADATDTIQSPCKYDVTDEPGFEPYEAIVDIIATSACNLLCASPGNTFFSGQVALGDEFVLDVDNAACLDHFKANTYIYIMDTDSNLLQTVQYHTSCSAPIQLGDVVGGVEVNGFFGTNGIGAELPDEVDGYGADADDPEDAIEAFIGDTVVWTYVVTRTGDGALSNLIINDDNGTPDNAADDFSPTAVMDGDYNVGDTNGDGVLDEGEQWLYTARDFVETEGPYGNFGTVSVTVEGGGGGDAGFTEYAVLANDLVSIANSFTVDGGFLGSNNDGMFALSNLVAPMGVRGAGYFGELGGGTIGTEGSGIEDAVIFNEGAMVSFGTTIWGNIHVGAFGSIFNAGAVVNGDEIYDTDPEPFEALELPDPLPFVNPTPGNDLVVPAGGTLALGSGNHYFDTLTFGDGASLELTPSGGPVTVRVGGYMSVGDGFEMTLDGGGAEDVYVQVGTNLNVGAGATWFGTVYASGDVFVGADLNLTGAIYGGATMSFGDSCVIQYAELDYEAVGIELGGGGTTVLTDSDSAHYIGVLPSIDISMFGQKAEVLVMQYTGDPEDASPVRIVASSRPDIDAPKAEIYFDGEVNLGETFAIDALTAGRSRLKGETYVQIFDPLTDDLLGTVQFHTSLSQPLVLGDQFGAIRLVGFIGDDGARAGIVPVEMLTGLSGFVFEDFNGDGLVDLDEYAVTGATVTLTGVNDNGIEINRVETTDSDGAYYFDALRPGNYTITETQPVGYDDGIDSIGSAGGTLGADMISEINLDAYVEGVNYNFAEHRADAGVNQVALGQTATIGFWAGRKGRKLIESLNGGKRSTQLGDWLAAEMPNIYGKLAGKTNKAVAQFYKKLFKTTKKRRRHGHHGQYQQNSLLDLNAQVMATALAIYVTDSDLAGNTAEAYGFLVTTDGVGAATFNVGDAGAAFGLIDGDSRVMTVWDILHATNDQSVEGRLYDMDIMLRELADKVYTMINEIGGID